MVLYEKNKELFFMRKILSMMISICAANALFASSLYTIRDGKLFEVERTYSGTYRTKIGYNPVNESEILVLSNFNDISIAFGDGAYADDTKPGGGGIAIGVRARAKRDPSVSGPGEGNIAIGNDARATGHMAIALGSNSKAERQHSIAIGFGADSSGKDHSVAVGQNSKATGLESSAFGSFAKALGEHSVGIGYGATAEGRVSIALGQGAKVTGSEQGSTAIGWEAIASGEFANAIGKKANASTHSNAIGFGAQSLNQSSAIGEAAYSKGRYSSAIGHQARSYANDSVAIGSNAVTYGRDKNTYTSAYSSISIGEFARAGLSEKLTQSEYDELDGRLQKNYYVKDGNGYKLKPFDIESDRGNIAIGTYSLATSIRSVAIGIGAESMSSNAVSLGYGSKALWNDSTALGSKAKAMANYSTAVGYGALARSERSVSVGYEAKARSEKSVSVGYEAKAGLEEELDESRYNSLADTYKQYYKKDNGKYKLKNSNQNNIAIGYNSESLGSSSLALGYGSMAAKDHAISLGTKSNTQGSYGISVGHEAKASNDNSIALGYQASAQENNSVALGARSVASTGRGVTGLDFATNNPSKETDSAWRSTAGAVSVGDKANNITRQITNVAAGTNDTDAVNVAQIKSLANQGFHTRANYNATDITKGNDVSHKLGGIIKVGGGFKLTGSNKNLNDFLSSENLATSINKDGSINLLMAKTPTFNDINISKDGKGGDYTSLTQWIKGIENSSSTNSNIKYFSVKSKEDKGNFDNKGATGDYAIAIGPDTTAKGNSAIAVGNNANADSINSISIGEKAKAIGNNSISMGYQAEAYDKSMSIGYFSKAKGLDSIAIGGNAEASGLDGSGKFSRSVAIGQSAKATGYESNALGHSAEASKDEATAIGVEATATEKHSTALGARARALGEKSIAIGNQNYSRAYSSIAIGHHTDAKGNLSIALGEKSKAQADFSTAIGSHSIAKEKNSLALGVGSQANINNSVALGALSIADTEAGKEGKYFGVGKNDDKDTAAWTSRLGAVSVGRAKGYKDNKGNDLSELTRQITNVAAGTNDTDAVNVAQLKSLKDYSDKTFAKQTDLEKIQKNLNGKIFDIKGDNKNIVVEQEGTTSNSKKISLAKDLKDLQSAEFNKYDKNGNAVADKTTINNETIEIGDDKIKAKISKNEIVLSNENNNKSITIKNDDKGQHIVGLSNTKWNGTTDDVSRAATEGQLKELQENFTTNLNGTVNQTLGKYKLKGDEGKHNIYGNETLTIKGDKNIKTKATEDGNLDIKLSKNLDLKDGSITLNNAKLDEDGLKVGDDVKITKDTIQNGDVKLTKDGLNNGGNKITKVADGEADDDAATVGQLKNIAVGASGVKESDKKDDWAKEKPKATGKNSVSIAGGSKDNGRSNTVSVGAPGHERTISNVAPGVLNSDAATVGQLKAGLNNVYGKLDEYKKDSRAGTASAMAIGNLPQSTIPGKGMVSLGGGFYDGESAMAIGLSKMSDDGKWVVKGSASYDSQENAGAAVSVGFHF
ncbi:outer membrane protein [Campylobacter hominis ATCC BAA-381]|uniref:Outer membrane protein n=2 Tax=Campylobacter hominis TaxID=76517 RepID=A7I1H4_CAMHC|nr:outer membrane protein [Campylobacter hominis ATCC BAA-381]UAK86328.1 YadA-like family protein [Campylobacter hominis]